MTLFRDLKSPETPKVQTSCSLDVTLEDQIRILSTVIMIAGYKHVYVADPTEIRDTDAVEFPVLDNRVHYIWAYDNFRTFGFFEVDSATSLDSS